MTSTALRIVLGTCIALSVSVGSPCLATAQDQPASEADDAARRPKPSADPGSPESQPEQDVERNKNAAPDAAGSSDKKPAVPR